MVKGGSTTLFGQGAFGGVVSLTSRLPDSNRVTFTRGYGISDDGDQDLSFAATGRLGMFAAGGRYSGKSRHYDASTLYTNIFHSLSAAVDPISANWRPNTTAWKTSCSCLQGMWPKAITRPSLI